MRRILISFSTALALLVSGTSFAGDRPAYGILLLAHGGAARWNANVTELASGVDRVVPTEVAFGMAQRSAIQSAVEKLQERGVQRIVAVPLFVSSHSSVITSTEYLLGLRETAPREVELFAKMTHGHGGHAEHGAGADPDATKPVRAVVPIVMTRALDGSSVVGEILTSRIGTVTMNPADEVVIVVAHGPVSDADNDEWLADMKPVAAWIAGHKAFHRVEYLTVRDDAPEPIRSAATAELRAHVEQAVREGKRVIVTPLLIAYGGIENGIRKRLEGLAYEMPSEGLLPDMRLAAWVRDSAAAIPNSQRGAK